MHFEGQATRLLDHPEGLGPVTDQIGGADLTVVNLETAITSRGTREPKKYTFRTQPRALDVLKGAGVDAVTIANNHVVDFGPVGLQDTLAARASSPIPVVGIGKDEADALAPALLSAKGVKVALIGVDQLDDETTLKKYSAGPSRPGVANGLRDRRPMLEAVRRVRQQADVVVVYLHWGTENSDVVNATQKATAADLAKAGADLVVGSHAHRAQAYGWLGESFVAYGLGNYVFFVPQESLPHAHAGYVTVTLDLARLRAHQRPVVTAATWTPTVITAATGVSRVLGEAESQADRRRMERSFAGSGLRATP